MAGSIFGDDPLTIFKSVYSCILLAFSVITILGLIANEQTNLSDSAHPFVAYLLLIGAVGWLTMVEGGQASLVGLYPVDKELYKDSHFKSYISTTITNYGDNLDRYLLGRQYMVVLVVFCVNISAGPIADAEIWGFPEWLKGIFFTAGLAMILITCMIGQLNTQVNASHCMLDYINNYFAVFTLFVAMSIEYSGLLHASYVVQYLVGFLAGKPIQSKEDALTAWQTFFFWIRCLASLAILGFCIAVTFVALFDGNTTMWAGVPPGLSVVVFIILVCIVGMLEGMQIAFFAVAKITEEERGSSFFAKKTCELLYSGEGNNLPGFMIGRQLCVVSCMIFVARVTSLDMGDEDNIFGVPDALQGIMNAGFLGATLLTILGSISWQLVAGAFPLAFLANPLTYILLRWCLFLEGTGICQGAWVIAGITRYALGYQRDEAYIGTAEERAKGVVKAAPSKDKESAKDVTSIPMAKLPLKNLAALNIAEISDALAQISSSLKNLQGVAGDEKANDVL